MKIILSFLFCVPGLLPATAQSIRYSIAQPYISLSAYSHQQTDPLSFTGNQAALAKEKQAGVGVFAERRFMLKETSAYTFAAAYPTRFGNFGIQLNHAGFRNFNENKIGLAYARQLGRSVDLGIQFNYYGYRVPAYGNASALNFEIGAMLHVTDKLNAGIHVYNPVGGNLGSDKEEKPASSFKAGLGYDASDEFFIAAEISKEEDKPVNVMAGLQYHFAKRFFARAGFTGAATSAYAGAGVGWKNFRLDISTGYHSQLGVSPGILLIVYFNGKEE